MNDFSYFNSKKAIKHDMNAIGKRITANETGTTNNKDPTENGYKD